MALGEAKVTEKQRQKLRLIKKKSHKLDNIKTTRTCSSKDNIKRIRRQATELEKIFAKDIFY